MCFKILRLRFCPPNPLIRIPWPPYIACTRLTGFGDRLLAEVRRHALCPKETKIRIAAPPERLFSTWIGGSVRRSAPLHCLLLT